MSFFFRILLIFTITAFGSAAAATLPKIAVVYPEASVPYHKVFTQVQAGIARALARVDVATFRLDKREPSGLRAWLDEQSPAVVITLGTRASKAYTASGYAAPDIVGLAYVSPQSHPTSRGIGLSPEPASVVNLLHSAAPEIERIWVVFNPARDQWAIDLATAAAAKHAIKLVALPATDLSSTAKRFVELFGFAKPDRDALWILEDTGLVETATMMPYVVEQSWVHSIPVVSNRLVHAEFGAALSVYPALSELGEALGVLALRTAQGENISGIKPLSQLHKAMNSRFVNRLGLRVDPNQFNRIFPRP